MPSPSPDSSPKPSAGPLVAVQPAPAEWSDEVRDIMQRPPSWLLRSGTGLLFVGVVVLFLLGWFIHYPDMITEKITLTGTSPVVDVVSRQSGHLASLRVQQKQVVKRDDILAIVRSPADADAVLRLAGELEKLAPVLAGEAAVPRQEFPPGASLGAIQPAHAAFTASLASFHSASADDFAERTAKLLQAQLIQKQTQITGLEKEAKLGERDHTLEQEKFARMKSLHDRDSISTAQFQEAEQKFLAAARSLESARKGLTEEKIALGTLEKELNTVRHQRTQDLRLAREKLRAAFNDLRAQIDLWQADYVLRAPADGTVAFHDFWSDQQYVTAGQVVFLIVPETTRLVARMNISQAGAGKISIGQTVRIKLQDFPYKEFGLVSGKVQSVSLVARQSANLVLVDLDYPLVSSYGRAIPFKQEMTGEASIVMQDMRLIGRIFNEIRKAFATTE